MVEGKGEPASKLPTKLRKNLVAETAVIRQMVKDTRVIALSESDFYP